MESFVKPYCSHRHIKCPTTNLGTHSMQSWTIKMGGDKPDFLLKPIHKLFPADPTITLSLQYHCKKNRAEACTFVFSQNRMSRAVQSAVECCRVLQTVSLNHPARLKRQKCSKLIRNMSQKAWVGSQGTSVKQSNIKTRMQQIDCNTITRGTTNPTYTQLWGEAVCWLASTAVTNMLGSLNTNVQSQGPYPHPP